MGDVIRFPDEVGCRRGGRCVDPDQPATVIILPVIRIERNPDGFSSKPQSGSPVGRRRRRAR